MTFLHTTQHHRPAQRFSIFAMLGQMHQLARQRRALAALDPHLRKDIGVSVEQAKNEASRPFWDAPVHFR